MCPYTVSMCVSPAGSPETSRQDGGGAGGAGQDDQPAGSVWPWSEGQETAPHLISQSTCRLHSAGCSYFTLLCDSIAADALNAQPSPAALAGRLQSNAFKTIMAFSALHHMKVFNISFQLANYFPFCFSATIITRQVSDLMLSSFQVRVSSSLSPFDLLDYCVGNGPSMLFPSPLTCGLLPGTPCLVLFPVCVFKMTFSVCQNTVCFVVCTQTWISRGMEIEHKLFILEHQAITVSKNLPFSILPPTKPGRWHCALSHRH